MKNIALNRPPKEYQFSVGEMKREGRTTALFKLNREHAPHVIQTFYRSAHVYK